MVTVHLDKGMFKTGNFHLAADPVSLVVDAVAVLMGDYAITRKMAANMILKIFLKDDFRKFLFENKELFPYSRNDSRVSSWKNKILSIGHCERCGTKEKLEAHHILHWADYPMGRIDISNGECLCHGCHTEEHISDQSYYMMKARYK